MNRIEKGLNACMRALMALAMFLLLLGGTWQIFTRWAMKNPSTFTDEFLRYVLIWASMIGAAYCFYQDEHLALDLVKDKTKGAARIVLIIFIELMILGFVGYVFIYGGFQLVSKAKKISSVMRIPYRTLYAIIPYSGIMVVLARALKYVKRITVKGEKAA